jgi:hypothetical protein
MIEETATELTNACAVPDSDYASWHLSGLSCPV